MNERIKELADQAWNDTRKKFGSFVDDGGEMDYTFLDAYDQKLAELIVRECITTMTNLESDVKQKFPWKKEEVVSTSGHIQKLKEHFGVEE